MTLPLCPDTRTHFEDISTLRMRNANIQDDDGTLNLHLLGLGLVDAEWVELIKGIRSLLDGREMRLVFFFSPLLGCVHVDIEITLCFLVRWRFCTFFRISCLCSGYNATRVSWKQLYYTSAFHPWVQLKMQSTS
ncbi:hypothetical protein PAXRUDRAFT_834679 [Paxillus rubicundulus Ve08.2h10]|uniref:Uncharacterized protein n=1 Tax=Paxillus rubicundulus Ve08.2h10 TaxID=930991 RepID=A0A0D0C4W5_9AGAM|nr:hypothetical protein PAXRUDRAFT_834679 [Paxillus rubicundulus Ve08.2h10]